jgi:hypothetical protein
LKKRTAPAFFTVLAVLLTLHAGMALAAGPGIAVEAAGSPVGREAIESGGVFYLPLRAVSEALGYEVSWSAEKWAVTVQAGDKKVALEPKIGVITDSGHSYHVVGDYSGDGYIGGGCILRDDSTYMASDLLEEIFGLVTAYDETKNAVIIETLPQNEIKIENIRIDSEDATLIKEIQYPRFTAADDKISETINQVIKAAAEAAERQGEKNAAELAEYGGSPNKCGTYFNYRITYNRNVLLCIVLSDYQYAGGAHGVTIQTAHTFSLSTGEEYALADLMNDGSGHVSHINSFIIKEIENRGLSGAEITPFSSISENEDYYLSNHGLVIYFQQYEYFPGAAGIQEFQIPYAELSAYLKPDLLEALT